MRKNIKPFFYSLNAKAFFFTDITCNGNLSRVNISGGLSDVQDAKKYIENLNSGQRPDRNDSHQRHSDNFRSNQYSRQINGNGGSSPTTIEIDSSKVGLVIGRGGSNIKEMERKYNVIIRIGSYSN